MIKLKEKVSWLIGRVQRSLFPQMEACCYLPLTTQEKHLIATLELIEIKRHIKATWNEPGPLHMALFIFTIEHKLIAKLHPHQHQTHIVRTSPRQHFGQDNLC